eukprot:NP_498443.2 Uncharacterized protein CELE_C09E7.5 [Caenorhabditis elegans]
MPEEAPGEATEEKAEKESEKLSESSTDSNAAENLDNKENIIESTFKTAIDKEDTKSCSECTEFKTYMNNMKSVLEETLEEEKEKNKKRDEASKKTLNSKNEEIEHLKKRVISLSNSQSENETMKSKISKLTESEKKLKETNGKVTKSRNQLSERVSELEAQLKREADTAQKPKQADPDLLNKVGRLNDLLTSEKQNTRVLQEEVAKFKAELESTNKTMKQKLVHERKTLIKEKLEQGKEITRLLEANAHLSIQNEEQKNLIQNLLDQQQTSTSNAKWCSKKEAENMVHELIALTRTAKIQRFALLELENYKTNIDNYLETVETNIQKVKRNSLDLEPLPEEPKISDKFMRLYLNEKEKQPSTSSKAKFPDKPGILVGNFRKSPGKNNTVTVSAPSSELDDTECAICLEEMYNFKETIKCECRRRFHSKCATKWLNEKRECPTCRKLMLNPSDYPPLK